MTRIKALAVAAALAAAPVLLIAAPQPAHSVAGPAFTIETTVMLDDGSDTCATENHIVVDAGATFRVCYTITNTGDEALTAHDVTDSRFGAVAGPGDATVVEPGESWSVTATGANMVSMFHKVTWAATGVDSGVEVELTDWVYITIEDGTAQLDMTVMIDDGTDTCGTESELTIPAGTQVRLCYTMTNTFTEALGPHLLIDEHLGSLLIYEGPSIEVGESLVHTEVAVIQESAIWISSWEAIGIDTDANTLAIDSVRFELGDPGTTTTTQPCPSTTLPPTTTPPTIQTTTTTPTTTPRPRRRQPPRPRRRPSRRTRPRRRRRARSSCC